MTYPLNTQKISRPVDGATLTEAAETHVEPYKLVKITFPVAGDKFFSEGQSTVFNLNTYSQAAIKVGGLQWFKDGRQSGKITFLNSEDNDASALILGSRIVGNAIEIYQTYRTTGSNNTPPVLIFKGECSSAKINPDTGIIDVKIISEGIDSRFVPNRYFSPAEGFNHIPAIGLSVTFGNEIFVFKRAK